MAKLNLPIVMGFDGKDFTRGKKLVESGLTTLTKKVAKTGASMLKNLALAPLKGLKNLATKGIGEVMIGSLRRLGEKVVDLGLQMIKYLATEPIKASMDFEGALRRMIFSIEAADQSSQFWVDTIRELTQSLKLYSEEEIANAITATIQMTGAMGLNQEQMKGLINVAGNLAVALGVDIQTALEALVGGMQGMTRTVLKYGINLKEGAVAQYMLKEGITDTWKEMTMAEQTQIRFNMIMEQSASKMGMASDFSNTLAGTITKLSIRWGDFIASIGLRFQPAIGYVSDWLEWMINQIFPSAIKAADWFGEAFLGIAYQIGDNVIPVLADLINIGWDLVESLLPAKETTHEWHMKFVDMIRWVEEEAIPILAGLIAMISDKEGEGWQQAIVDGAEIAKITFETAWLKIKQSASDALWGIIDFLNDNMTPAMELWLEKMDDKMRTRALGWGQRLTNPVMGAWDAANKYILGGQTRLEKDLLKIEEQYQADVLAMRGEGAKDYEEHMKNLKEKLKDLGEDIVKNAREANGEQITNTDDFVEELEIVLTEGGEKSGTAMNQAIQKTLAGETSETTSPEEIGEQTGTELATGAVHGFEQEWYSSHVPMVQTMYQEYEDESYEAGEIAGTAAGDGFQEGFQESMGGWSASDWTGTTTTESGYEYLGHYYINVGGQWGYQTWRNGLPVWVPASQGFLDWLASQTGGSAFTGGMADLFKGIIPSFQRGGQVLAALHDEEVVLPNLSSGHDYQGFVSDRGKVAKKPGSTAGQTVQIIHLHGVVAADYDGTKRAIKQFFPVMDTMANQGEITPKFFKMTSEGK